MKTEDELLRNARNDSAVSDVIRQYFYKYPNSKPKECCKALKLDYSRYGGRTRKIKHDLKVWRRSETTVTDQHGRPLEPQIATHRLEYGLRVPPSFIVALNHAAVPQKTWCSWYRSSNRNRQVEYCDEHISIRLYQNGTCRILQRQKMTFEELRVRVEDAFGQPLSSQSLLSEAFARMMAGLQIAERHRTFRVGPLSPFRVDYYRDSLGLDIFADGSHPGYLEARERWPSWISPLLEAQREHTRTIDSSSKVVSDFTTQIKSHLHVMEGLGSATDRLNEAVGRLSETISRLGRTPKHAPRENPAI